MINFYVADVEARARVRRNKAIGWMEAAVQAGGEGKIDWSNLTPGQAQPLSLYYSAEKHLEPSTFWFEPQPQCCSVVRDTSGVVFYRGAPEEGPALLKAYRAGSAAFVEMQYDPTNGIESPGFDVREVPNVF